MEEARTAAVVAIGVRRHCQRHPARAHSRSGSTVRLGRARPAMSRQDVGGCRCAECATYWDVVAVRYRHPCW